MWVVKLGGSLCRSPALADWLRVLIEHGGGRVVIVPGGGPFADTVRQVQKHWRFSDVHAHHMALLAMEQYAWMMTAIEPRLVLAQTHEDIFAVLAADSIPVWQPYHMLKESREIPTSWSVSADSLAAWLAQELGAENLLLVKSMSPHCHQINIDELTQRGIVDDYLSNILLTSKYYTWWMADKHFGEIAQILSGEVEPSCKIIFVK